MWFRLKSVCSSDNAMVSPEDLRMQQGLQRFNSQLAVAQNLMKEARSNCFTRVDRDHCRSPILMPHEVMAAAYAEDEKSGSFQCSDQLATAYTGSLAHAAMVIR